MVKYNAVMTLLLGAALMTLAWLGTTMRRPAKLAAEGWGLALMGMGVLVGALGFLMSVTWPLTARPHLSMLFGNVPMILGPFLFLAGMFLYWRWGSMVAVYKTDEAVRAHLQRVLQPFAILLFATGLGLAAFTIAVFNYQIFGSAPPAEPIKPWFAEHVGPWLENGYVGGLIYGLSAVGTLLAPWGLRNLNGKVFRIMCGCLAIAGAAAILYGALHFYTHIGLGEAF